MINSPFATDCTNACSACALMRVRSREHTSGNTVIGTRTCRLLGNLVRLALLSRHMHAAMRSLLLYLPSFWLVVGAFVWPHRPPTEPAPLSAPVILFTFDRADEAEWDVVNDGVMGGRSAGFVAVEQGTLRFTGTLVTQGGGFTSVRARRAVDLTGELGIELRVRGSGRPFEVELDDGVRAYGRTVSRRAPFQTSAEWTVVRVPFSALRSTIFGRAVNAPAIDVARIRGLGLYMADGQDGAFRLEVDYVRSYGAGTE